MAVEHNRASETRLDGIGTVHPCLQTGHSLVLSSYEKNEDEYEEVVKYSRQREGCQKVASTVCVQTGKLCKRCAGSAH